MKSIQDLITTATAATEYLQNLIRTVEWLHKGSELEASDALVNLQRAIGIAQIELLAEDGKVAVIESGRDCDCVEYDGRVHIIEATVEAFDALHDSISEWADGPFRLQLSKVSEATGVKYQSRDLVMEARENGHPHYIVSQYP